MPTTNVALIGRLVALHDKEGAFGPAYQPIYHAMLSWYEKWGCKTHGEVDADMTQPNIYAEQLADALEQGRNFIAEHPGAGFPACLKKFWLTARALTSII